MNKVKSNAGPVLTWQEGPPAAQTISDEQVIAELSQGGSIHPSHYETLLAWIKEQIALAIANDGPVT